MANGIELAKAYVQIVPSADGIQGNLEKAMSGASESAGKAGGKGLASGLGSALGGVAKVAAAGLATATTAVGGFGAASVKAGMDFDKSMAQVAATMGVSVDEIEELRTFAQEMGASTAFSATEAADALNYMALAGYDAETSMAMLPNVLNLAAAGGIDLAAASDMVTDASSALGLSLDDTYTMVDQMARTSSKTNTSVAQLGDAILTIGGTAKDVRGGTQELASVLGVLADNGIKGSEAGTHLRNILLSLTPKSEDAAIAMEKIGLNAYDAQGELRPLNDVFLDLQSGLADMSTQERQNVLGAIFNKTDLSSINALLSTTSDRWDELEQEINGAWYTSQGLTKAFDEVIGYNGDLESFAQSFAGLGLSADTVKWALDSSGGSAEQFVENLGEAVDAGISLDDIINAMPMEVGQLQKAFDGAGGAAQEMANTQLDNLSGDITLFQSALEGAKIAVSDSLTPSLREFVNFGTDGVTRLTEAFQNEGLTGAASVFGDLLGEGIQMIVEKLPEFLEMGSEIFKGLVDGILAALPVLIENLPTMIETFISMVLDIASAIIEALPTILQQICDALPVILPQLIDGIVALFVMLCENFQSIIDPIIQALPDIINSLTDALIANLPQIIGGIIMLIAGIIAELPSILVGIWETITHFFTEIWNEWVGPALGEVGEFFSGIWDGIVEVFQGAASWFDENVIQPVVEFFRGVWESVSGFFKSLWDDIVYWFDTIIGPWIEIAKRAFLAFKENVIDPLKEWFRKLWEGIKSAASTAWNAIVGVWNTVSGWFNQHIIQPITGFFSRMWEGVSGAARKAWEGIKSVFSPIVEWFRGVFQRAWQGVKNVFSAGGRVFEGIKEGIVNVFKTVVNAIIRGINAVVAVPFNAINGIFGRLRGISILKVQPFSWLPTLNVPQIPQLFEGGVLEKGQTGLLEGNGAEAVVPLEKNTKWIRRVAAEMSTAGPDNFMDAADEIVGAIQGMRLYLDGNQLVGGVVSRMDKSLGGRAVRVARGVATV